MIFRQLFDKQSSTYTYLLADESSREAVLIDSVDVQVKRDLLQLKDLNLELKYLLETHVHADHITGSGRLKNLTGAKSLSADPDVQGADRIIAQGDVIEFGNYRLRVLATPGHTAHCVSFVLDEAQMVFTGDTLLIGGAGRTDFQEGDPAQLYCSIVEKLFTLPENYRVYPAHDYHGHTFSNIGYEKAHNKRVAGKSSDQFIHVMKHLDLSLPKRINEAVPANMRLGLGGVNLENLEVDSHWLANHSKNTVLIDVREMESFTNRHIPGSVHVDPSDLHKGQWDPDSPLVVSCRSGRRSLTAVKKLRYLGYPQSYSLKGGILDWEKTGHSVAQGH